MYEIINSLMRQQIIVKATFALLGLLTIYRISKLAENESWKHVAGTEYSWIAKNISEGHGYSFNADNRWLFCNFVEKKHVDEYFATAWEEPIYPFFLAAITMVFGYYANLIIISLHIIALYITSVMIYLLIRKIFNTYFGLVVSVLLLLFWKDARLLSEGIFSPAIFAGMLITFITYIFLWFLENISIKRAAVLGAALGVLCLTLAAFILIVPITILIVLIVTDQKKTIVWKEIAIVVLAFGLIILPWIIRNIIVFGEFVPFRNGVGQGFHMSNPMVAATCYPGYFAHEDLLGGIWKANNFKEALNEISMTRIKRMAIYRRSFFCIQIEAPKNYQLFNEAQRDKVYLKSGLDFAIKHPSIFLSLTFYKLKMFLVGWNKRHVILSLLAILGVILSIRNRNVLFIALFAAGYIFTFSFIGAWFYRYRYPVEPIMIVLASGWPVVIFKWLKPKIFPPKPI